MDSEAAAMLAAFAEQVRDPAQPLSLVARFRVAPASSAGVEAAFERARRPTLDEPGCRMWELHRDPREEGGYVVYEQWRSLADLEAHFAKDYFATIRKELAPLLAGVPEFQVVLPVSPESPRQEFPGGGRRRVPSA